MASILVPYALSTLARVKAALGITSSTDDNVIESYINAATDWIEAQCGGRRFLYGTHDDEVTDGGDGYIRHVFVRHAPVASILEAQYRAGSISAPSWTDFDLDEYELKAGGRTGIIEFPNGAVEGSNNLRFSYLAGYKIDFSATGSTAVTAHTLPADLTYACETLAAAMYNRRQSMGGIKSESLGYASITYGDINEVANADIKAIIGKYVRVKIV